MLLPATKALPLINEDVSLICIVESKPFKKMSQSMSVRPTSMTRTLCARFVFFIGVWLMIANWNDKDIPVGLLASALALWISLSLLPPTTPIRVLLPLAKLSLRFLSCSIIAGIDVARRALLPRLDLRPGFVAVPLTLPPGDARNAFLRLSEPSARNLAHKRGRRNASGTLPRHSSADSRGHCGR